MLLNTFLVEDKPDIRDAVMQGMSALAPSFSMVMQKAKMQRGSG